MQAIQQNMLMNKGQTIKYSLNTFYDPCTCKLKRHDTETRRLTSSSKYKCHNGLPSKYQFVTFLAVWKMLQRFLTAPKSQRPNRNLYTEKLPFKTKDDVFKPRSNRLVRMWWNEKKTRHVPYNMVQKVASTYNIAKPWYRRWPQLTTEQSHTTPQKKTTEPNRKKKSKINTCMQICNCEMFYIQNTH